jgi:hypothetical protein
MNLFRALVEALNPCIHQWEKLEVLKDDPENPTHIKIVSQCFVCGEVRSDEFNGPKRPQEKHSCVKDGHHWTNLRKVAVIPRNPQIRNGQPLPESWDYEQQCTHCGDLRVKRL